MTGESDDDLAGDDQISAVACGVDENSIGAVDVPRPGGCGFKAASVARMAVDEPSLPLIAWRLAEPGLVELIANKRPWNVVDEQIVALGNDDAVVWLDGDLTGDRFTELPVEARRIDDVVLLGVQTAQHREEPPTVEGVDRALAVAAAKRSQGCVGQMEPVHRQVHSVGTKRLDQTRGKRRLARPRTASDADDDAPLPGTC